jgi:hypothetical protein
MKRLCLFAFMMVSGAAVAGEAEDLVARVKAAYGDAQRLEKLDGYRVEGRITAIIRGGDGRVVRDLQAPMKLGVDLRYPGHRELRVLDGLRGWRGGPEKTVPVSGMQIVSMAYQFLRSDVPRVFDAYPAKLESLGARSRDGKEFRLIRLNWSEQLEVDYWLEASSHRVLRVEGHIRSSGMAFEFATDYSEFRKVDDVLFPFREENHAGGRHVATTIVESVTFDPENLGPFAPRSESSGE